MKFFTLVSVQHNKYLKSYKYQEGVLRCYWTEKLSEAVRLNEPQAKKFRGFFSNYSENQYKAKFHLVLDYSTESAFELA